MIPEALRRPQQDVLHGGVRRRPRRRADEPVRVGADGADAAGELLRDQRRRSATRSPGSRFPATSFPQSQLSPTSLEAAAVLPGGEPGRARANNCQAPSANTDNVDQFLVRVDQNIGNKVAAVRPLQLARQLQRQRRSTRRFRSPAVTQPRVNKNTLVSYTHTLRPNLLNDFRIGYHRIDFDTLNPLLR